MFPPAGVVQDQSYVPWTPAAVNPTIWIDDTGFTVATTNITSWANNGSLGGSFDAANAHPQLNSGGLNGRDIADFQAADRLIGTSHLLPCLNNKSAFWMLYVYELQVLTGDEVIIHITENTGAGSRQSVLAGNSGSSYRSRWGGRRTDAGVFSSRTSTNLYGPSVWVMMLGINDYQNAQITLWVNGAKEGPSSGQWGGGAANTPANNSAAVWLGAYANSTSYIDGQIAEIIAGDSMLTTDEINRLFGYAAHGWGLTANLPVEHPYKNVEPFG